MKNYIKIGGVKIELTDEQAEKIKCNFCVGLKLSDVNVGETFKIGKYEFIVLEHSKETTAAILKDLLYDCEIFGGHNNYVESNVDKKCSEFGVIIANIIGENNLIKHTVDLIADDGLKDYGKVIRNMSLITAQLYRRYVEILDKYKIDKWWWTATAHSTPKHGNKEWVKCVSPSGSLNFDGYINYIGVRPFCILNSNIFVSK